jgi:hypothetical protein
MKDRELLEAAAKGRRPCDRQLGWHGPDGLAPCGKTLVVEWQPLTDDGDALRLAAKLGIGLSGSDSHVWACKLDVCDIHEPRGSDSNAATRRAIVRAAAAMAAKESE